MRGLLRRKVSGAQAAGYTGDSGQSWFDFVDASMAKYRQNGYFDTAQKAEDWLKESIVSEKTCFGKYAMAVLKREGWKEP